MTFTRMDTVLLRVVRSAMVIAISELQGASFLFSIRVWNDFLTRIGFFNILSFVIIESSILGPILTPTRQANVHKHLAFVLSMRLCQAIPNYLML